jgi:hypothetical protein
VPDQEATDVFQRTKRLFERIYLNIAAIPNSLDAGWIA